MASSVDRRSRALTIAGVFTLLLLTVAGALYLLRLSWFALAIALMVPTLLFETVKSLRELEGERVVLESSSRFRDVVELGVIALGGGLAFAVERALRGYGVEPPWRFGWGTTLFIALPVVLLSFRYLVPRLCAWAGIGIRAARA